jgi:hypothetical protein
LEKMCWLWRGVRWRLTCASKCLEIMVKKKKSVPVIFGPPCTNFLDGPCWLCLVIYLQPDYLNFVAKPPVSCFTKVHGIMYPDISESLYLNGLSRVHLKTNLKWGWNCALKLNDFLQSI